MSAIYGIINLDGKPLEKDPLLKMEQEYRGFKIDRFSSFLHENAAFGTGIMHITRQSRNEKLPYYDEISHNLFTADCYLDNRTELLIELKDQGLSIGIEINEETPDGMLIYLAYLKWGKELCDHLLGVFAIVIYDYDKRTLHLYMDHCGERCLHYYLKNNTFYFSTIIKPIQAATDNSIPVSEKYIAACESSVSADMVIFPGMSPFDGVYQLLAGQQLTACFGPDHAVCYTEQYWDPTKTVRPLNLNRDDDYRHLFLETYSKCVTDALRVDGNVGCFLSSGLDSTSVAALASLYLKEKGETLHSYTSVPIREFLEGNDHRLEDESIPVQKFCDHFGNIKPTYISCEGKSALTELEHFVTLFNSPIKYGINAVWMEEIYKRASEDGCKILLKGQHGNCSVSYGGLIARMWSEIRDLHFITAARQFKEFSANMNVNKKAFLSAFWGEIAYELHPKISFENALTKESLLKKYNLRDVYLKRERKYGGDNVCSKEQWKRSVYMPSSFQQVSYANAHFELESGLITRDPTRDKRIIELCISMPISCFADGKYERRLITDYMKDIVPNHIIRQIYKRGLQSADYIKRIEVYTPDKSSFIKNYSSEKLYNYLDKEKLDTLCFDPKDSNISNSLYALSLYYFLCLQ